MRVGIPREPGDRGNGRRSLAEELQDENAGCPSSHDEYSHSPYTRCLPPAGSTPVRQSGRAPRPRTRFGRCGRAREGVALGVGRLRHPLCSPHILSPPPSSTPKSRSSGTSNDSGSLTPCPARQRVVGGGAGWSDAGDDRRIRSRERMVVYGKQETSAEGAPSCCEPRGERDSSGEPGGSDAQCGGCRHHALQASGCGVRPMPHRSWHSPRQDPCGHHARERGRRGPTDAAQRGPSGLRAGRVRHPAGGRHPPARRRRRAASPA